MKRALTVARWEYVEKIKSKAFLVTLFLMPMIMVGFGVIPGLLASRPDKETKVIGIVDASGMLAEPLARNLDERYKLDDGRPNYVVRSIEVSGDSTLETAKHTADSLTVAGDLEGYVIVNRSVLSDSNIEYRSKNVGNFRVTERLSNTIRAVVVEKKLIAQGLDPSFVRDLTKTVELRTIKISETGKEEEAGFEKVFFTSYIFMMMMFFLVMTSGQLLVRSMLEEKSNRVVEVLMSSCSPSELMAGKIVGLSGLGFTQMAFWGVIGVAISLNFSITMIPATSALLLLVYFVLGYLFYAGLFVAAGSPVSTEQEAQQITSYVTLLMVVPIVLAVPILQDPNAMMVRVLSFVPLLTPTMMAMRIPLQMPSFGELAGTIAVLFVSVLVSIWAAGKIFRTAILMYGKRASLAELIRIIKLP